MRQIFGILSLFLLAACGDRTQKVSNMNVDTAAQLKDTSRQRTSPHVLNQYGFDTTYEISKGHHPFMVTGYFNTDEILDTAILVRHQSTGNDALFIKHGGTGRSFLLKNGMDIGSGFDDFRWVGQFEVVKKGKRIWNNVVDGDVVGEDQVPGKEKVTLQTDGIFIHESQGGGGGIIYFSNERYVWVQQD